MGRIGDGADVLQVAGRVEEMGRRHQRGLGFDPLGESLRRDGHSVAAGHELDLELRPAQPLMADRREVELADEHLASAGGQRQARGQGGQGNRNRRGDCRRAGRRPKQLRDAAPEPLEQRQPG